MAEERRKALRRSQDRELRAELQQLRSQTGEKEAQDNGEQRQRKERRRAIRHNCAVQLILRLEHSSGSDVWSGIQHPVKGRMLDLSVGGCSVFTQEPLESGQSVALKLGFRNGLRINTSGVVRWTKRIELHNGFGAGIEFHQLKSEERRHIQEFLEEMDTTIGL